MSPKISQAQLNANNKTYAVDDFRNMVNYKTGTNKGYVRFSLGQNGQLKLEKFNNKVDVPLSWRSNTKTEHNRAMREKFAEALGNDLKYASDATRLRIREKILSPKDSAGRVQEGKALSRRDIKAALEEFDKVFNTQSGRSTLLSNFFQVAMKECGFKGDVETFKRDYMKLDANNLGSEMLEKYCEETGGEGPLPERMLKSEVDFRALLSRLDGLLDAAKQRVAIDTGLKGLVGAALETGDAFGLDIANQGGGKFLSDIRAGLTRMLALKGIQNAGNYLEVFLAKVLPFYLQDGIANVRDYAGGDKAKEAEAIKANFDFEELVDFAAKFIGEAKEAAANAANAKPLTDKDYGVLQQTMENLVETKENVDINLLVAKTVMQNANVTAAQAKGFGGKVVSMKELFRSDAAVENCAARFVIKHFARGSENMLQQEATTVGEVKKFLNDKLVPALQLQSGERWSDGNGNYMQNGGVKEFIKKLTDHMQDVIDQIGGGKDLYKKLFSHTLPDIINKRIEKAVKRGDRMHFEGGENGGLDFAAKQINRVAMAYREFCTGKAEAMAQKAVDGFNKMLARQQKQGNITGEEYASLKGVFLARIKNAFERAVERYFQSPPPEEMSDDVQKDVKSEVQRLVKLFNEEKSAAISETSLRLNTAILSHSLGDAQGVKAKRDLMDASKAVDAFVENLSKREKPLDKQFGERALRCGLEKLYFQTLDKMLQNRKVGKKPIDAQFVEDVQKAFAKAADDHVAKAETFAKKLDETVRKQVNELVNSLIDPNDSLKDYVALGKDERKALVDALTADAMLSEHSNIGTLKEHFLENPESAGEESAEAVVKRESAKGNTLQNLRSDVLRAGKQRILAAAAWLDNTDEQGQTLEARLLADEKQRLKNANPEVSKEEIANIAKERMGGVMKRANDFVILYTIGGRKGFTERIGKELAASSDARMKTYTKFRAEFLKLVQPSLDKCSSLGKENLDAKLAMVLEDASRQDPPPDPKILARAFDKMLTDMVNGIIDKKFDAYVAYSKAYTAAFNNANPVLNDKVEARVAELKDAGATDDDIVFFRETIVPRLRDQMEYEISEKSEDWLGQAGKDKAAKLFDDTFNLIKRDIESVKLDPSDEKGFEDALRSSLDNLGFVEFMDDPATSAAVKENVTTWLKGDNVQEILKNMRRAQMTTHVYDRYSQAKPAQEAREAMRAFNDSLRAAVTGIQGQILMKDFNATKLEPVLKLFELWLEQYDLPKLEISRGVGGVWTLKDMALEHFTKRVKDLQQRIATEGEGAVKEPLLSPEYLDSFVKFIHHNGTAVMLAEMKDKVKAREMTKIIESSSPGIFNVDKAKENGEPLNVVAAINVNKASLDKLFDMNMQIVENEMRDEASTVESLKRWRENIEERFAKHMRNTNALRVLSDTRVCHVRQLNEIGPKSLSFLNEAISNHFGGVNIMTSNKVSDKLKTEAQFFFAAMTSSFVEQTQNTVKELESKALKTVHNPLKSHQNFPIDTSSESALSDKFRVIAKATVEAACDTPKFRGLVKQFKKELGIK